MDSYKIDKVYKTNNYSKFKRLLGNRDVTSSRVAIIKKSIEEYGYISNPILCNEKLEVIDGQGRLQACRELSLPIEYRVVSGIGISECLAMNLKPTAWSMKDVCKSYAERGNENYARLLKLMGETGLSANNIVSIVYSKAGKTDTRNYNLLREEKLVISDYDYQAAKEVLEKLQDLQDVAKEIGGRRERFYPYMAWAMRLPNVDEKRLLKAVKEKTYMFHPIANKKAFFSDLTKVYNKGLSKGKVYFEYELEQKGGTK